jgi:hypothetical protein
MSAGVCHILLRKCPWEARTSSNTITFAPKTKQIAAKSGLETVTPISLEFFQQNPSNILSDIKNLLKNGNLKNPTVLSTIE